MRQSFILWATLITAMTACEADRERGSLTGQSAEASAPGPKAPAAADIQHENSITANQTLKDYEKRNFGELLNAGAATEDKQGIMAKAAKLVETLAAKANISPLQLAGLMSKEELDPGDFQTIFNGMNEEQRSYIQNYPIGEIENLVAQKTAESVAHTGAALVNTELPLKITAAVINFERAVQKLDPVAASHAIKQLKALVQSGDGQKTPALGLVGIVSLPLSILGTVLAGIFFPPALGLTIPAIVFGAFSPI
jgi:hypothetical protein